MPKISTMHKIEREYSIRVLDINVVVAEVEVEYINLVFPNIYHNSLPHKTFRVKAQHLWAAVDKAGKYEEILRHGFIGQTINFELHDDLKTITIKNLP
jgi:hypothetical protein